MGGKPDERVPAKISRRTQTHLRQLTELVAQHGWEALGIQRTDLPTQISLLEEAVKLLKQKADDR